jgi:hypothetical protein
MGCCVSPMSWYLQLLLNSTITCNTDIYTDDIVTKTNSHHMIPYMNWSNRPCYEEKQQPALKRAKHESSMHVAVFDNQSDFLLHNDAGKSCADGFSCPICNRHQCRKCEKKHGNNDKPLMDILEFQERMFRGDGAEYAHEIGSDWTNTMTLNAALIERFRKIFGEDHYERETRDLSRH